MRLAVSRQPSNGLKFNRQPSKKGYFLQSKMQIDVNQKPSKSFKIFQISLFQLIFILRSSWTSGS